MANQTVKIQGSFGSEQAKGLIEFLVDMGFSVEAIEKEKDVTGQLAQWHVSGATGTEKEASRETKR